METDNKDYIIPKSKIMHLILYYVHGFVSYKHFDIYYNLKALLNKYYIKGHISNKQLCDIVIDEINKLKLDNDIIIDATDLIKRFMWNKDSIYEQNNHIDIYNIFLLSVFEVLRKINVKLYFPKVNSIKLSEWRGYERGMTKKLLEQSLMKENIFLLDKRFENQE